MFALLAESDSAVEFALRNITLLGLIYAVIELTGVLTAIHAVMNTRTSQGAVSWAIVLCVFPIFSLPAYWIFGRNKFTGYVKARRVGDTDLHQLAQTLARYAMDRKLLRFSKEAEDVVLEKLATMPFTVKNQVKLLINGDETFGAIFDGIESAKQYIVLQFFIVHDDELGNELQRRLIKKAEEGVRVLFLYDEIGCYNLPDAYIRVLRIAGVEMRSFHTTKGDVWNRFQLNFRNHRKIVIVDGQVAFVGGLNVGDEYMGRSETIGPWRDTHVQLVGPSVHAVQLSFLEDWHWATGDLPDLDWTPQAAQDGDQDVLVIPTGPADRMETCGMLFVHLINSARRRMWIASPYFVPDQHVIIALQLAALRGVDVRIMLPEKPDHILMYLSSFSYLEETDLAGVGVYRYQEGFMHHKVILVDDELSGVGTANLDNRSFRLNFELTIVVDDERFNGEVAAMLQRDFECCKKVTAEDFRSRPIWFRAASRLARLMSPIQ